MNHREHQQWIIPFCCRCRWTSWGRLRSWASETGPSACSAAVARSAWAFGRPTGGELTPRAANLGYQHLQQLESRASKNNGVLSNFVVWTCVSHGANWIDTIRNSSGIALGRPVLTLLAWCHRPGHSNFHLEASALEVHRPNEIQVPNVEFHLLLQQFCCGETSNSL